MALSFEYDPKGELKIFCDVEGASLLKNYLDKIILGKDTHFHLMTPSWGGDELTDLKFDENAIKVNQVLINIVE